MKATRFALPLMALTLFASDPKPSMNLDSVSSSRHRTQLSSSSSSSSQSFDENALRLEAILENKELGPFVVYENKQSREVSLTLAKVPGGGPKEILAVENGQTFFLNFTDFDSITIEPGSKVHFAARTEPDETATFVCFNVYDGGGSFHYTALWLGPLAQGKARVLELPYMPQISLGNALTNWCRAQTTNPSQVSTSSESSASSSPKHQRP